eukprot:CAMPEP_0113573702 /NCGR_PEP_ID=MMETSP0015_2-20120614/26760_1 /TAXON_ID=2838 /ORGANISM="Odontella" /LENGTH=182 /DNA_ID=CAMNT_0000476801 /DNA_START=8 /DNA_END=553 /DNA_ORIENTATION=+ /assembly_acc=CAM_ASM_000160
MTVALGALGLIQRGAVAVAVAVEPRGRERPLEEFDGGGRRREQRQRQRHRVADVAENHRIMHLDPSFVEPALRPRGNNARLEPPENHDDGIIRSPKVVVETLDSKSARHRRYLQGKKDNWKDDKNNKGGKENENENEAKKNVGKEEKKKTKEKEAAEGGKATRAKEKEKNNKKKKDKTLKEK